MLQSLRGGRRAATRLRSARRWAATDSHARDRSSRSLLRSVARDAAALQARPSAAMLLLLTRYAQLTSLIWRRLQHLLETLAGDARPLSAAAQALAAVHARGDVVFATGIGKSAIVAQRLASTLASISVRSRYVHGSEWTHGELGCLRPGDAVVILSHSGQTAELLPLPPLLHAAGCSVLAVTGSADSALAQQSDVTVVAPAQDQAHCPVPSRSIIVQEAIVNALVEHLVEHVDERAASFRRNHPAGAIGSNWQCS